MVTKCIREPYMILGPFLMLFQTVPLGCSASDTITHTTVGTFTVTFAIYCECSLSAHVRCVSCRSLVCRTTVLSTASLCGSSPWQVSDLRWATTYKEFRVTTQEYKCVGCGVGHPRASDPSPAHHMVSWASDQEKTESEMASCALCRPLEALCSPMI